MLSDVRYPNDALSVDTAKSPFAIAVLISASRKNVLATIVGTSKTTTDNTIINAQASFQKRPMIDDDLGR